MHTPGEILHGARALAHPTGKLMLESSGTLFRQMELIARIAEFHRKASARFGFEL